MRDDPEGTLRDLQRILDQVVRPAVRDHSGQIFKLLGDGALVEFHTATMAISATHEILQRLRGDPVRLRAGVHVGDVTEQGGDIFGEAVNMAARLQALAEPGGGLVSKTATEVAGKSADIALKPESSVRLKGFDAPVDAYSIDLEGTQRQARLARMAASQEIRFTRALLHKSR
ncbi:adenylate/guanylate cyclase domain-containing protein [Marimonas sp. MJW-29]|uniref:Adenylate/guanylate cyclase domain-containing protein n=1 Tax=Sulfitobacter sediminis TaxID=3234186 RepID=A0ABV3RTV2_9RHOB